MSRVLDAGDPPADTLLPVVTNVGRRPTFYPEGGPLMVEAYLLDFDGDLYGERARLRFVSRLRGEERFESADALVAQMNKDVEAARAALGSA